MAARRRGHDPREGREGQGKSDVEQPRGCLRIAAEDGLLLTGARLCLGGRSLGMQTALATAVEAGFGVEGILGLAPGFFKSADAYRISAAAYCRRAAWQSQNSPTPPHFTMSYRAATLPARLAAVPIHCFGNQRVAVSPAFAFTMSPHRLGAGDFQLYFLSRDFSGICFRIPFTTRTEPGWRVFSLPVLYILGE